MFLEQSAFNCFYAKYTSKTRDIIAKKVNNSLLENQGANFVQYPVRNMGANFKVHFLSHFGIGAC